jgi:mannose-6-phosphate isomerase-like protein (cupin superfamily)
MKMLRAPLEAKNLGLTVIDEDSFEGKTHNHEESDHEEIYMLVKGDASIILEGDEIEMREGDALRVDPETDRKLHSEHGLLMVIAGAP